MKIEKVKIKEFKCLQDFEANIDGGNIMLLADNGRGKSSFIQFIEIALGKTSNIPVNAQGSGEVVTDKDGRKFTFAVKFKDGKPVVTVTTPDGLKDTRKGALSSIVGAMDFDINEFVELSKSTAGRKKQIEIFKSFLPTEIKEDLARYEQDIKAHYEERTDLSKDVKRLKGAIEAHPLVNYSNDLSVFKKIDIDSVLNSIQEIGTSNGNINAVSERQKQRVSEIEKTEKEILELKNKLSSLETGLTELKEKKAKADIYLSENKLKDVSVYEAELKSANEKNIKFEQAQQLSKMLKDYKVFEDGVGELTVKIEMSRQAVQDAVKDCSTIVTGLTFDDETLLYNGVPVNEANLSTSEIMELGVLLKMAENPELGILFLQRGESLGKERMAQILELCNKNNWQIIMEQVVRGKQQLTVELIKD